MAPVAELLADRYELGIRLGSGGMGDVFQARDHLLERTVAVKVPTTTVTPASAERFKREARSVARLNHPNVVGVYDWAGGTTPFIVMEFVEGRSLRAELRARHSFPPADVAAIGAQIADALAHAHHHGVVHRDVKPSNVILTPGGSVKVTDFGIAHSVTGETTGEALTEPGVVLGTVGYLSPEQVAGLPADARSDIYSLGVVLSELLVGERPSDHAPTPDTELERVVARARAADPSARYQSAAELRDALRAIAAGDDPASTSAEAPVVVSGARRIDPPARTLPVAAESALTAGAVTVDTHATQRAPGHAATSVLPAAAAAGAAATVAAPPAPSTDPARKRRFRRAKTTYPKVAKAPKPVKPLKPPKPKRGRGAVAGPPSPPRTRTWKLRHWAVILAAPLVLVAGGALAYAKLTASGPSIAVPDVVFQNADAATTTLRNAGFAVDAHLVDDPSPGGTVLRQSPTNGHKIEEGSTIEFTVARPDATVPYVAQLDLDAAKAALARKGLQNLTITPDFRGDVDPGTVMATKPGAYSKATKADPLEVVVATDPHVEVPSVVQADQESATNQLKFLQLNPKVETASSKTIPAGSVIKVSPAVGTKVVRGDTVTITVSTGPRQIVVDDVRGQDRDDAVDDLEGQGFVVSVASATATGDQVDQVLDQSPVGVQAAEGSTVTITVGVRARR